nr:MAG TPA: hypothetical protein [Caudoviricetes sp.]
MFYPCVFTKIVATLEIPQLPELFIVLLNLTVPFS